jgi:predicted MFS family arabinose efflux permease
VGFSVAAPALVPALVPRESLAAANGRIELARSAAYAGGPALAGALVAWAGASSAFVLATVLSASAVALLVRLPEPQRPAASPRKPMQELQDGAHLVWRHDLLRPILLTSIAWNISWFVLQAAYVPYALRHMGLSAATVGLTLACYGAGMVVGALGARQVVARMPFGRAVQIGPFASVLAAAAIVGTLFAPSAWVAAFGFFCFGAGPIVWTITSTTLRQAVTPSAMLGRVSAIFLTAGAGARPIGAALGGVVGASLGEAACLWLALAGFALQAVVITASAVRSLRELPASVPAA